MLKKLLKYELKSSARTFLPLYVALVGISAVNTFFSLLSGADFFATMNTANIVMFFGFYGVSIAISAVTFFIIIRRFSRNLLGDEGYLMFTLPVPISLHIVSKLISAILWTLFSGLTVLVASILLLTGGGFFSSIGDFFSLIREHTYEIYTTFGIPFHTALLFAIGIGFFALCSTILLIYLSIAIGHLMRKHKTLASVVVFVGINTIVTNPVQISLWLFHNQGRSITIILVTLLLAFAALSALYFAATWFILSKKLNLE